MKGTEMFKQPLKVDLGTDKVTVDHKITVSPELVDHVQNTIKLLGATAVFVVGVTALSNVATEVTVHTAKTLIK